MVNTHRKGRLSENRLRDYFAVNGYEVELLRLQGAADPGDLWLPYEDTRIEIKDHARMIDAINQAIHDVDKLDERFPLSKNYAVVKRPGKPPADWYAIRRVGAVWPAKQGSPAYMFGQPAEVET